MLSAESSSNFAGSLANLVGKLFLGKTAFLHKSVDLVGYGEGQIDFLLDFWRYLIDHLAVFGSYILHNLKVLLVAIISIIY